MNGLGTAVRGAEQQQSTAERLGLAGWLGRFASRRWCWCWCWFLLLVVHSIEVETHAGVQACGHAGELREEDRRCVWVMIGRYLFTV